MEQEIDDLEYAIDNLDTVITTLSKYEQFKQDATDLAIYKSALEGSLYDLKQQGEELQGTEQKIAQKENIELEKQYWKEVI